MLANPDFRNGAAAPARAIGDPVRVALDLQASGQLQEALQAISAPGRFSADLYNLRGDLQLELGQIDEAVRSYNLVIEAEPGNLYAHYNLAQCLMRQNRWENAALLLRKLLSYDPCRDNVRIRLAECLLQMNRLEDALVYFEECRSEALRRQALFGKAVVLQLLRRFEEAEPVYRRLLELNSSDEEALSNLIALSMELFDLPRVQSYATSLLELNPQSLIALQGLTLVAIERREYDVAAVHFSRLVECPPGDAPKPAENSDDLEYRVHRDVVERMNTFRNLRFASSGRRPLREQPNGVPYDRA